MTNFLVAILGLFFFSAIALAGLWMLEFANFSGKHFLGVFLILLVQVLLTHGNSSDGSEDRVYFISQEGLQVREVLYDIETGEFTVEVLEEEGENE